MVNITALFALRSGRRFIKNRRVMANVFKSEGVKRSLTSLLAALFAGAIQTPAFAPYANIFLEIVGVLGGIGVIHGGMSMKKKSEDDE